MAPKSVDTRRYLIIAGMPRSGTTSLFNWLAGHPEISAALIKQTNFFLRPDYPAEPGPRFDGHNIGQYSRFFPTTNSLLRLEASPDYLYGASAHILRNVLPNARLIVIERDPVERAVSWYRYARQKGLLARDISFADYIRMQLDAPVTEATPVHLRALEQSRLASYLGPYQASFGTDLLHIAFADLKRDPPGVMATVCRFAGINPDHFAEHPFTAHNRSGNSAASPLLRGYFAIRDRVQYRVMGSPVVFNTLRRVNAALKQLLPKGGEPVPTTPPDDVTAELRRAIEAFARSES